MNLETIAAYGAAYRKAAMRDEMAVTLREAKGMALAEGDTKAIKAANKLLLDIGRFGYTHQELAEQALSLNLDCVRTALYRHYDASGRLLYVGISLSAISRLADHRDKSHWFNDIARVDIEYLNYRSQALAAERKAIKTERPLYNTRHASTA